MRIFNIIKKAGIALSLLLVTTIINSNYQYANADKKVEKSSNKKSKNIQNASETEKEAVKNMYEKFQKLISKGVTADKVKELFTKYFVENLYQSFGIKKENKDEFNEALSNHCVKLLSSDLISQTKGYKLTDKFSKIKKKKTKIIKCQLKKEGEDGVIDMSVILTNDKKIKDNENNIKIKDFSIMNSFSLIKGARNVVENYCKKEKKEYKKLKSKEKLEVCKKAWEGQTAKN